MLIARFLLLLYSILQLQFKGSLESKPKPGHGRLPDTASVPLCLDV